MTRLILRFEVIFISFSQSSKPERQEGRKKSKKKKSKKIKCWRKGDKELRLRYSLKLIERQIKVWRISLYWLFKRIEIQVWDHFKYFDIVVDIQDKVKRDSYSEGLN